MVVCSVRDCFHIYGRESRQFFRFPPPNSLLMKSWLSALGTGAVEPSVNSRICSCHFPNGDKTKPPTLVEPFMPCNTSRQPNRIFSPPRPSKIPIPVFRNSSSPRIPSKKSKRSPLSSIAIPVKNARYLSPPFPFYLVFLKNLHYNCDQILNLALKLDLTCQRMECLDALQKRYIGTQRLIHENGSTTQCIDDNASHFDLSDVCPSSVLCPYYMNHPGSNPSISVCDIAHLL
nr:PREDICTED: uncharacterized protein LOC109040678 [Bemisia tabaci]